jgi:DNA polymerase III epsilon subunit-like protein
MSQRKFNPDKELNQVTFVVLDLETSGASATTGSAITEIGAVKICGERNLPDTYQSEHATITIYHRAHWDH